MSEVRLTEFRAIKKTEKGTVYIAIDHPPTIDAVEVVRCRDCCLGKPFKGRLMCHWMADKKGWGACATTPDHYCADGKRKEGADGRSD